MKKSKKGNWTLDNPRYQYIVDTDNLSILIIKMYQFGFNKITFMIQKNEHNPNKFIEVTYPKYYADEISFPTIEHAMQYLVKLYNIRLHKCSDEIVEKIEKYKTHLFNVNPEFLI